MAVALLVPPTAMLYLALLGLLIGWRYRRIGLLLAWFGAIGLLLLGMPVVSGMLLGSLEEDLPLRSPDGRPPQAIVILGGDVQHNGSRTPILHLGPLSLERALAGAELAQRTDLPILVTGGKLRPSDQPVAVLMADFLEHEFQTPVEWVERASRDTWENAHFSAPILRAQGIRSVYVVTEAWHMRRAILSFRGTGITVTAAPTNFDRLPTITGSDFVPTVGAWRASYFALHEWIGLVWYQLRYKSASPAAPRHQAE